MRKNTRYCSGLVTSEVKNKMPDVSDVVKKRDYLNAINAKIWAIEKNILLLPITINLQKNL